MNASIIGADPRINPDKRDSDILADRFVAWKAREGPRVGDWIIFSDGVMHRFSYDWSDVEGGGIQTSEGGSFYFGKGYMSFSGGLNPCVPTGKILNSGQPRLGRCWFFHHGFPTAHSAVYAEIECRVYATELPSTHWHR